MGLKSGWDAIQNASHGDAVDAGWWDNEDDLKLIVPVKLCLIHSEVSEAMEGHRKGLADEKLPNRPAIEVELADAIIRIGDLAGRLGLDVGGAIDEKMAYNRTRNDHKPEVRAAAGGKRY